MSSTYTDMRPFQWMKPDSSSSSKRQTFSSFVFSKLPVSNPFGPCLVHFSVGKTASRCKHQSLGEAWSPYIANIMSQTSSGPARPNILYTCGTSIAISLESLLGALRNAVRMSVEAAFHLYCALPHWSLTLFGSVLHQHLQRTCCRHLVSGSFYTPLLWSDMLLIQLFLCEPSLLEGSPKFCSAFQPFFGVPLLTLVWQPFCWRQAARTRPWWTQSSRQGFHEPLCCWPFWWPETHG